MEDLKEDSSSPSQACSQKPPRQGGTILPTHEKVSGIPFPAAVSTQELRCLKFEKENREMVVDECSPRCVLEDSIRGSDSETSSSKASTSCSEAPATRSSSSLWKGFVKLWKQKSLKRLSSFPPIGVKMLVRKRSNRETYLPITAAVADDDSYFKPSWKTFTLSELQMATNNFNPDNIVGKGGYADVFKGCLENGQLVAVKRLTRGTADEKTNNFLSELGTMVHLNHPNIARLIGIGVEGGMHLVFQLSAHGSLEYLLHDSKDREDLKDKLDWSARYKVAIGMANGLHYLHEECPRRIIHRDIKAANVLLSEDLEPQICDFGLAKWLPEKLSHQTVSCFEGTFGYLAPEYCMHGIVDEKTDVFSFGVLLLELITGHKALDTSKQSLVLWVKPLLEKNDITEIIDPSLSDSYDPIQIKYVVQAANMCIQYSSALRPCMSQVLKLLKGEQGQEETTKMIQKSLCRRTYSEEIYDVEEYNTTRYLKDLRRHKQIALDF